MKYLLLLVMFIFTSSLIASAAITGIRGKANDGYLLKGEYDYDVNVTETSILSVMGGGGDSITVSDYGRLNISSTSKLNNSSGSAGGVWTIGLNNYSSLIFSGGETNDISVYNNSTVLLTGGKINNLASYQSVNGNPHITIECLKGWSVAYNNGIPKIMYGNWADGTPFEINFINNKYFKPVFENMNIVIVPEPGAIALLSLGGLILKRRR